MPILRLKLCSLLAALYAALTSSSVSQLRRRYEHPSHLTQNKYTPEGSPAFDDRRFCADAGGLAAPADARARRAFSPASIAAWVPCRSSSSASTSCARAQCVIFSIFSSGSDSDWYPATPSSSLDASKSESSSSESRSRSGFFAAAARAALGSRGMNWYGAAAASSLARNALASISTAFRSSSVMPSRSR